MSSSPDKPKTSFGQLSLRTLFLLTAAIAVWIAIWINRREAHELTVKTNAMRPLARELKVNDPTMFGVVRLEEHWYDENRWDIHIPEGKFRLKIATQNIADAGLATDVKESVPLPSGRITLELVQVDNPDKSSRILVFVDDKEVLRVDEPEGWYPGAGSSGGSEFQEPAQQPADKPLILFRRRFTVKMGTSWSAPTEPCNGVQLWIENEDEEEKKTEPAKN